MTDYGYQTRQKFIQTSPMRNVTLDDFLRHPSLRRMLPAQVQADFWEQHLILSNNPRYRKWKKQ